MKILHTSDWHIGNFPGPEKNGVNLRGLDIYRCIEIITKDAYLENPDLIVVAGDIFHTAKVWADRGLSETNKAIYYLEELSRIAPVAILRGTPNHDGEEQFNLMKEVLKNNKAITIFDYPTVKVLETKNGIVNVAGLPGFDKGEFRSKFPGISKEEENQVFTEELGKLVLGLKAMCRPAYPSILVSHYTVPGCNTESGQTQFLAQFEPVLQPEVLDSAGFDLVALGHIHKPQQVQSCKNTFYSGAINALNFNDEGQERGFWIHQLKFKKHIFIDTPYRFFKTLHLDDETIEDFNNGCSVEEILFNQNIDVVDTIVRVLYNCTDENNKALNKALLEKQLYKAGAFWVKEITPNKITITANRNELSESNTPEDNLREYLIEKAITDEQIEKIVQLARPIIDVASAGSINSVLTGLFIPVEIEVKNYRNYKEEMFNFNDISFCTINGKNGAGKSTLFMDAILDCLYEEPREGDLTGWISNDEKARSGSIKFTFAIGDKTFRVTRTRTKSGKATLNLSELIECEWLNRSKEKLKDTQQEIVNILGMDSLTMKSCALIMQDQYGLFLQADKESRMNILGNILGLGIYGHMEDITKDNLSAINRQIRYKKEMMQKIASYLPDEEELSKNITSAKDAIEAKNHSIKERLAVVDNIKIEINTKLEAGTRALNLTERITTLEKKKNEIRVSKQNQESIIKDSDIILAQESNIIAGVHKYNSLLEQEKELLSSKALYDTKLKEIDKTSLGINANKLEIEKLETEKQELLLRIEPLLKKVSLERDLKSKFEQYNVEKAALEALEECSSEYIRLGNEIAVIEKNKSKLDAEYNKEYSTRTAEYKNLKSKATLLDNSDCIDSELASCKFLKDAQEAKRKLEPYSSECKKWQAQIVFKINELESKIIELQSKRTAIGYDIDTIKNKRLIVNKLETLAKEYELINGFKQQIEILNQRVTAIDEKLKELREKLKNSIEYRDILNVDIEEMRESANKYTLILSEIEIAKAWLDREKLLPVAKEKKSTAKVRLEELNLEYIDLNRELDINQENLKTEKQAASGSESLNHNLMVLEESIESMQGSIQKISMELGSYNKQLENMNESKSEIKVLEKLINTLAEKAAVYEELKKAFSQDGIPHNIIRSIIPQLEAIANNILGQMSGGKMSMEFVTEKLLKSNNKKEVVTLDIIIDETGIGRLPYLSKSGGERVKTALSAILALAEIKSSRAGIQLGMLFIDEPPFLDGNGIQAYCDALETIQSRYKNLKIMAITHDPTMKARFPQSLDVVKTDEGSKVVY